MEPALTQSQSILELFKAGGWVMYPLLVASLLAWFIIIERFWQFRKWSLEIEVFQWQALSFLARKDINGVKTLCDQSRGLPIAEVLRVAIKRMSDESGLPEFALQLKSAWPEVLTRERLLWNQKMRGQLWLLGTIGSSAPFIGLFGTVIGILRSFHQMAQSGSSGFAVVASGISESLIATAAGIVVAVISVIAYNAFQNRWGQMVLVLRLKLEELAEYLTVNSERPKD